MDNLAYKYNRFLITLMAFAPFTAYFFFSFLNLGFETLMIALSYVGVILLLLFKKKSTPIIFPKYLLYYLLFIIYVFYSAFIQLNRDFEVNYLFKNSLIGGLNFMFIIENLYIPKKHYKFIVLISINILVIAIIVIVYQQVVNPGFFVNTNNLALNLIVEISENESRLVSIYSWLGRALPVGFGFVPIFIFIVEKLDKKKKKIIIWLLIGILFAFLSKARWIMLNSLLVFVLLFVNHKDKTKQFIKYIIPLAIILPLAFYASSSIGIDIKSIVNDRILESNRSSLEEKSAGTRILAIKAFNKFYWDKPIFGHGNIKYGMGGNGPESIQDYELRRFLGGRSSQIHIGYLSLFYLYGLIGAFFFLSFMYYLFKKLLKDARMTKSWAPLLGFIGFAIANLTLVTFTVFHMGLIIMVYVNKFHCQQMNIKSFKVE